MGAAGKHWSSFMGLLRIALVLYALQAGFDWTTVRADLQNQVSNGDSRHFKGRALAQTPPEPSSPIARAPPSSLSPPTSPQRLDNGALVTSTIRLSGANFTALTSDAAAFVQFQTNFKDQLISAAQKTGYSGELQVSIDSIRAGSVVVSSTAWFLKAATLAQPQAFADTLRDNVAVVFATSGYFLGLPSGQITSTNVTVTAGPSNNGSSPTGGKSSTASWLIWVLVAVAVLLVLGVGVAVYLKCTSQPKQDDHINGMEDVDEDYDLHESYAQLVAEAQGYEREHPSLPQSSAERVVIPNIPAESPWHIKKKITQLPGRSGRSAGKGRGLRRATSGPVMFTSGPQGESGPLPGGKPSQNGAPNETPTGGAPSRIRTMLRSISGPIKVIWPSPAQDGRMSRVGSGSWSGMLSGRWSGMLGNSLSRSNSRLFSGPVEQPGVSQRVPSLGLEETPRRPGTVIFSQQTDGIGSGRLGGWHRSMSATSLSELPAIRHVSAQLSGTNGGSPSSKEAASPLVKNNLDSAAEPPQPMAMLRSGSNRFLRPSRSFGHLSSLATTPVMEREEFNVYNNGAFSNNAGTAGERKLFSGPIRPSSPLGMPPGTIQMGHWRSNSIEEVHRDIASAPSESEQTAPISNGNGTPEGVFDRKDTDQMEPVSRNGRSKGGMSGPVGVMPNSFGNQNSSQPRHSSGPIYFA